MTKQESNTPPVAPIIVPEEDGAISSDPIEGIDAQAPVMLQVTPNQSMTAQGLQLTLAPSPLSPEQIRAIRCKTPTAYVKERPGRGGKRFKYVPIEIVKRKLNFTFGYGNWTFKVNKSEIIQDQWVVLGTLRISFPDDRGNLRTAEYDNAGGKELAYAIEIRDESGRVISQKEYSELQNDARSKCTKKKLEPVDVGDDLKAAIADCLKKCASMTGMFSDVYAPEDWAELKERQQSDQTKLDALKQDQDQARKAKILADVKARLNACKTPAERKKAKEQTVANMKKAEPSLWKDEDFASL